MDTDAEDYFERGYSMLFAISTSTVNHFEKLIKESFFEQRVLDPPNFDLKVDSDQKNFHLKEGFLSTVQCSSP